VVGLIMNTKSGGCTYFRITSLTVVEVAINMAVEQLILSLLLLNLTSF
jgi:hypothetical protein